MQDKRIQVLSQNEINAIYDYPELTPEEQCYIFDAEQKTLQYLRKLKTVETKLYFMLMFGYFKAKCLFYKIDYDKSHNDIIYLINRFFPGEKLPTKYPGTSSITKIKVIIKTHFKNGSPSQQSRKIQTKLKLLAKNNIIPTHLLKSLLNYLYEEHIPIPAYSTLQTLLGETLSKEEKRLMRMVSNSISINIDKQIEKLLRLDDGLYHISALKSDPKGFNRHEMQKELEKFDTIYKIFNFARKLLPKFDISTVNKNYYASLAVYYDAYQLRQFKRRKYQLYIICFVYNQFFKVRNNIIDAFIHYVRLYDKKGEEYGTIQMARVKSPFESHRLKIASILDIFDTCQHDNYPFKSVKKDAFKVMPLDDMRNVKQLLRTGTLNRQSFIWQFHSENHQCTALNIRPLFMAIDYTCVKSSTLLKDAIRFMRFAFKAKKALTQFDISDTPTDFISSKDMQYLITASHNDGKNKSQQIDLLRYEYFVYQQLERGFQAGTVFCNSSIDYKSLEHDLQLKTKAKAYKKFISQSEIPLIKKDIVDLLNEQKETLEALIERVNDRILSGENKFVTVKVNNGETKVTIPYVKIETAFNDPFFDDHEKINIVDLLVFVDKQCGYSKEFLHLKEYQSKKSYEYEYLLACILANATGLGINKIASSSHLNYDILKNLNQSRIRLETLRQANKTICDKTARLPIFREYDINGKLHGSTDGQKFDVRWETFKSRYLRKYFKEKGVSAYSMIVNHVALDSMIIGGHESHYLFDIVFNNMTNIRPDILSTDTEGSNSLNFLFLELLSVAFAPWYKSIGKKLKTICGFNYPKYYKDKAYVIRPSKKVNESLIAREWGNALNIFAAMLSGDSSQSTIVKKLSSHERDSDTKNAIWEYNRISMSIYLLLFVDDIHFRNGARKSLNRGEGYHQLKRAIVNTGGGDFRGKSEIEIMVWNECARLVANAIIYYNAYLLSNIFTAKEKAGNLEAIELLKKISPIAWQHINLLGMYDFSLKESINIERVLSAMLKNFDNEWSKTNREPQAVVR